MPSEPDFSRCRIPPFKHQIDGIQALIDHPFFFLCDEMGNGKTKQVIDAAQFMFEAGTIDKVLIIAPASVRSVWYDEELGELRKHLFVQSSITEFHARVRNWLFTTPDITQQVKKLKFVVTNYELLVSKNRVIQILPFCTPKTLLVLDESAYIRSYDAARTKACFQLRRACGRVVLLNGTPVAQSPLDLFSQGNMMSPQVHGLKYITHFKSIYAVEQAVVSSGGRTLMSPRGREIRTIVGWRNLEDLTKKFAPYVLRRLKKDCLDLPPALDPVTYEVPLTPETWRIYKDMRDELVVWLKESGDIAVSSTAAIKAMRLSQITSGFLGGIEDAGIEEQDNSAVIEGLNLGAHDEESTRGLYRSRIDGTSQNRMLEDHRRHSTIENSDGSAPQNGRNQRSTDQSSRSTDVGEACTRSLGGTIPIGREKLDFVLGLHREWLDADPNLKLIVWCRFRVELARMMKEVAGLEDFIQKRIYDQNNQVIFSIGQIHGGQKRADREAALRLLDPRTAPSGPVFFGGTYGTGALGINLTACHTVINMSADYSLWKAQQTAARVDRPGQVHAVSYFDIVATGPKGQKTIDHAIIAARRSREDVASWTTAQWLTAMEQ